jgi:transcription elongation factor Elf1
VGTHKFATGPKNAHDILAALKSFLICPHCGSTEVPPETYKPLGTHKKSQSSFVLQCRGECGLKFYVRRADLAETARRRAEQATDPAQALIYERVAALFEPKTRKHQYAAEAPR